MSVAGAIAENPLFAQAGQVDADGQIPPSHFDLIAEQELYGICDPSPTRRRAAEPAVQNRIVEVLAGGCVTTAFVWAQHHSVVSTLLSHTGMSNRDTWLRDLFSGRARSTLASSGLRLEKEALHAEAVPSGWRLSGVIPWVTGWGHVDVLLVAARLGPEEIIWFLVDAVDAKESTSMRVDRLRLIAANGSGTVSIRFDNHVVPTTCVTHVQPFMEWAAQDDLGYRRVSSLALGVAGRCCHLLQSAELQAQLDETRDRLDTSDRLELGRAKAMAADLAVRSATALMVAGGARSALAKGHAQRLARESLLLLVVGSRRSMKHALLDTVTGRRRHAVCAGEIERLSGVQTATRMAAMTGWRLQGGRLHRTFHVPQFTDAMVLVDRIAEIAERINHHPNVALEDKRKVHVVLWTHKMSALTELDFEVATEIDTVYLALTGASDGRGDRR